MTSGEDINSNENQIEKPTFYEVDGVKLEYKLDLSSSGSYDDPLIVFIGGKNGNTPHDSRYSFLAEKLSRRGFNCARTQYRRDILDRTGLTQESDLEDINKFIDFLKSKNLNAENINFVGKSIGCLPLLSREIAGKNKMILLAPVLIIDDKSKTTKDAMTYSWGDREVKGSETITSTPDVLAKDAFSILIIHGSDDKFPKSNSENLVNHLQNVGVNALLELRSGATHHFDREEDLTYLVDRIESFTKQS